MLKWILNSFPPIPSIQIIEYRLFHYTSCYKMLSINSIESSTIRIPTTDIYKKKITTFIFNGSSSLLIYSWKAYFSIGWHSKFWSQNKAEKQQKKQQWMNAQTHSLLQIYTVYFMKLTNKSVYMIVNRVVVVHGFDSMQSTINIMH